MNLRMDPNEFEPRRRDVSMENFVPIYVYSCPSVFCRPRIYVKYELSRCVDFTPEYAAGILFSSLSTHCIDVFTRDLKNYECVNES